jgi:hypothetical protein
MDGLSGQVPLGQVLDYICEDMQSKEEVTQLAPMNTKEVMTPKKTTIAFQFPDKFSRDTLFTLCSISITD